MTAARPLGWDEPPLDEASRCPRCSRAELEADGSCERCLGDDLAYVAREVAREGWPTTTDALVAAARALTWLDDATTVACLPRLRRLVEEEQRRVEAWRDRHDMPPIEAGDHAMPF